MLAKSKTFVSSKRGIIETRALLRALLLLIPTVRPTETMAKATKPPPILARKATFVQILFDFPVFDPSPVKVRKAEDTSEYDENVK